MSSERSKRRGKRNDYAFNGSFKIYDDDDEEEEGGRGEEEEVSQKEKSSDDTTQQEDISIHGKTGNLKPDPQMKLERKLHEPDPDYDEKGKCMGTASNSAISGGQEPDLHGDRVGATFCNACSALSEPDLLGECVKAASHDACSAEPYPDLHAEPNTSSAISGGQGEPDPDLHGDRVGAASCNACSAEPDPDLHGERVVEAASQNTCSAEQHVDPANDQDFSASKHLYAAPDHHHHHLSTSQHHTESEPINPDQQAAEPDPDLHGECAMHANNSDEAHVESDDMHAAISELRQKLGMMKSTAPYSDDPRDILSHQPAEILQTLQAAA